MDRPDRDRSGADSGQSGAQTTPLSDSGDVIRDRAERTGHSILQAKRRLLELLAGGAYDPRDVMLVVGQVLQELECAEKANEKVKEIIYEKRRRS